MQLLVDNRSDSTKMYGATIRFILKNELGKHVEGSGKYRIVCSSAKVRNLVAELTIYFS